jgi:uncharacterized protein YbjT (DUF2867 family)
MFAGMTILVTGATGNVGRHVVAELHAAGHQVRALTRDPARADLPTGVEVVGAELPALPDALLTGVRAVFLVWPFTTADAAGPVIDALARHVERVVFLSARGAADTPELFHAKVETMVRDSGVEWTFLRAGGFAANTLEWAEQVRAGVVRWVHGGAGRSLIHERDIADVAVRALTEPGHAGAAYELTGPETLTQAQQVRVLGETVGHEVRWEEMGVPEARGVLAARGWDASFLDSGLAYWATLVDTPETVTKTVEEVTGTPARTYAEWATDHAADFR